MEGYERSGGNGKLVKAMPLFLESLTGGKIARKAHDHKIPNRH